MQTARWWHPYEETSNLQIDRATIKRVLAYARPFRSQALLLVALIAVTAVLHLVSPLLFRDLIDNALPNRNMAQLNWLGLGLFCLPVLTGLGGSLQRHLTSVIGEGIIYDLRRELYAHMQRLSLRFYTHTKTGEMMSRLNDDVGGAQELITGGLVGTVTHLISLVSILVAMVSLEWRLTLLGVAILPLFILPLRRIDRVLLEIAHRRMQSRGEMSALMHETLNVSGALLAKVFGRQRDEGKRFAQRAAQVRDVNVRFSSVGRWFRFGLELLSAIGIALVYWLGGHLVLRGTFSIGTIVAVGAYLARLYVPLVELTHTRALLAAFLVSFERVFEVLDMPLEIDDRPHAVILDACRGHVRFEEVSFGYGDGTGTVLQDTDRFSKQGGGPDVTKSGQQIGPYDRAPGEDQVLQAISFEMQPGQLTALVGPSGAGKTTITYLVPRLYDPTAGRVLLDGHDLRDLQLASLAEHVGMVTQETYLFHDTIRANLLYARPDATQGELEDACRAAHIHAFIAGLPDGYETVVGERGYRLSGGEKQRVAIARVVLKDPCVLILDEATSHLDSENEALIQEALERVMVGRTSLVIAHRLSTVLSADQILVIDQGRLVQQGTHEELLAQGGLYRDLYERQFAVTA